MEQSRADNIDDGANNLPLFSPSCLALAWRGAACLTLQQRSVYTLFAIGPAAQARTSGRSKDMLWVNLQFENMRHIRATSWMRQWRTRHVRQRSGIADYAS